MGQITGNMIFHIGLAIIIFAITLMAFYLIFQKIHCRRLKRQLELEYGERQQKVKRHFKK